MVRAYNESNGTHFKGAPVVGSHRKKCTDCGGSFTAHCGQYYYTDVVSPWGADKFCGSCMRSRCMAADSQW